MDNDHQYQNFKIRLNIEMERINSSYREIYGNNMIEDVPTATTYTDLYLMNDLPWVTSEMDEQVTPVRYIKAASAPSRDLFLSTASSAIYNVRLQDVLLSCDSLVGLLLIAIYMSSFQQFYAIVVQITNDPKLR